MESRSRNDIFYLILLILTVVTMLIGITFTYLSLIAKDKNDSTRVQTGSISINYIDGEKIDTYALIPINEPTLNTKYSVYKKRFSVRSDGSLDQTLDIYINVTDNKFKNNALGFSLYDSDNRKIATVRIPSSGRVNLISNEYLKNNTTNYYTVLIWLQDDNTNQNYEMGNTFVGGFDIDAQQLKYE